MNVEEGSFVAVDTAFHIHQDLGPGLLESAYEAVLVRMLEERGLRVERQVSVAFDFNGMHFDERLRVFASSRESESEGGTRRREGRGLVDECGRRLFRRGGYGFPPSSGSRAGIIVLNAKFDTYPMRKAIPAQENAGLVADDFFERLH